MKTSIRNVALFTAFYLTVATVFAFRLQNWEFVFYIIVVLAAAAFVAWLHTRITLSPGVLWALSIWGLMHMIGGLVPLPAGWPFNGDKAVFYSLWLIPNYLKYDQIVHAYGFGVGTWVSWQVLRSFLPKSFPPRGILTICILSGMGLGALNEIVEFVAVLLIPNTNVGGYENTGWDLVANFAGCVIAALIIRYIHVPKKQ